MNFEPNDIFRRGLLPVTPRSISLAAHDPGSLTLVQGHHKNPEIKVVFLLGKSVCVLLVDMSIASSVLPAQ